MKLNPSIVAFYCWICCEYLGVNAFVSSFTKTRFQLSSERFSKEGDKADIYNMNSCVHPNSLLPGGISYNNSFNRPFSLYDRLIFMLLFFLFCVYQNSATGCLLS